jgi:hypothetical protein
MMLNELRTLLLNLPGPATAPPSVIPNSDNYPGDEFVPYGYVPAILTPVLQEVWNLVLGINPDRAWRNYWLRELLAILHTTELAEFVYALDPRVTYWPAPGNNIFNNLAADPLVEFQVFPNTPDPPPPLLFLSSKYLFTPGPQLYYQWLVYVGNSTHVSVQPILGPNTNPVTYTYTTAAGLSSPVPLIGTDQFCQFQPVNGAQWLITWLAQPTFSLAQLMSKLDTSVTEDQVDALFGVNTVEPFTTFKNLFLEHPYPPYRTGGLVLALGYRISQLNI